MQEHAARGRPLIDVRSPDEFSGRKLHLPEYPQEGVLRGGHVPGARNVPWARAANNDGTFKDADSLRVIYEREAGLKPGDNVITYCRIGERSSHTWFVLTYLLGYRRCGTTTEAGPSGGMRWDCRSNASGRARTARGTREVTPGGTNAASSRYMKTVAKFCAISGPALSLTTSVMAMISWANSSREMPMFFSEPARLVRPTNSLGMPSLVPSLIMASLPGNDFFTLVKSPGCIASWAA